MRWLRSPAVKRKEPLLHPILSGIEFRPSKWNPARVLPCVHFIVYKKAHDRGGRIASSRRQAFSDSLITKGHLKGCHAIWEECSPGYDFLQ